MWLAHILLLGELKAQFKNRDFRYEGFKSFFVQLISDWLLSSILCAVLFDGPVGEEAWPEDGSVGPPLMALGEEEIDLLQKVQEVIKANPGKAESLFG